MRNIKVLKMILVCIMVLAISSVVNAKITQISDINPGDSDSVFGLNTYNNKLYFTSMCSLYKYDSTTNTINFIFDGGTEGVNHLTGSKNALYFVSDWPTKLYKYDGAEVTPIYSGTFIHGMIDYNDALYFADGWYGKKNLFKYDDITNTVTQITNTSSGVANLTIYNGFLYFTAYGGVLFKYNDITKAVKQVTDVSNTGVSYLAVYNGSLYFNADSSSGYIKIFKYDAGTNQVMQITNINPNGHDFSMLKVASNDALYFDSWIGRKPDGSSIEKLFKYDGTNVTQISDIIPGDSDHISSLAVLDNTLYFSAASSIVMEEMWPGCAEEVGDWCIMTHPMMKLFKYDTSTSAITQISDLTPDASDDVGYLTVYNNKLYFAASSNLQKNKLFCLDFELSPPALEPIGNKIIDEGDLLQFTVTGSDPDEDTLTYSASNLPPGANFDPVTQVFSWIPNYSQAGSYAVHFDVSDGELADSEDIIITVNNVTAEELIVDLIQYIGSLNLQPSGIVNSLIVKLQQSLKSLQKGNVNAAINKINAFINEVEALNKLTNEQADELIESAEKIIIVSSY